ncbi:MAG: helix-turn-helix domain-containing protein [Clostridiales Family XIII bacterium]|jgi:ArsR family transcriptional regulator|nr:helix-turn-helix domain-containing protein [Clostridiales Family XIII bacterium]
MRLRKTPEDNLQEADILLIARVSDALAHPARIKIFRCILQCNAERISVCNKDIVERFNYSQSTISQHIRKLVQSDLVQVKRQNAFSLYFANVGVLRKYVDATQKFR